MRRRRYLLSGVVSALAAAVALLAVIASSGGATPQRGASPRPASPSADARCPDPGRATPIVFVHGLGSQPSDFTRYARTGVASTLAALPGVAVSYFDYHAYSFDWVTNSHIGPGLAADIACLADTSRANGGPGQVVVVAHSMGGLALREAAVETVGGRSIASRIGLAVTIATPNTGSWIEGVAAGALRGVDPASPAGLAAKAIEAAMRHACTSPPGEGAPAGLIEACGLLASAQSPAGRALVPGSPQLAALAPLPVAVPLFAVAGDIHLTSPAVTIGPLSLSVSLPAEVGDLLVKPDSALAEQGHTGPYSGTFTDSCTQSVAAAISAQLASASCEHGDLLYDPKVSATVSADVSRYLSARA